jgi:membrane protein YqaA with SNARE-associated domain
MVTLVEIVRIVTHHSVLVAYLRHLGALGLFLLAILDSSPLPTFGGPDILTAVLAASHGSTWYEYAIAASLGSVIGAYLTFRLARRAGMSYLRKKFGQKRVPTLLKIYAKSETGVLTVSSAVPFPFPTSVFFAAAGASNYNLRKFIAVVAISRAARYSLIAILADYYGRHFISVVSHPDRYWGWLVFFAAVIAALAATGILINRKLEAANRHAHHETDHEYVG